MRERKEEVMREIRFWIQFFFVLFFKKFSYNVKRKFWEEFVHLSYLLLMHNNFFPLMLNNTFHILYIYFTFIFILIT